MEKSLRGSTLLLLLLMAVALLLRIWGIGFGLPFTYHPDEHQYVESALRFVKGDLNPHRFNNPALYKYLLFLEYGLLYLVARCIGSFPSLAGFEALWQTDLAVLYEMGIANELFPLLIFIGIGAMTDFGPLLENPITVLLGAAAQFGIFGTLLVATVMGFDIKEAASIGIIGSADGPTSIYVSSRLAPQLLGPIAVAAYSYMSLVPIIQPPIMKLMTTKQERLIKMPYTSRPVSKLTRILFPIVTTLICGLIVPMATPLIGMLMFGNLMRECGVVDRLSRGAENELTNIVTILLGITIGSTMDAESFLNLRTIMIVVMGLVAFSLDTAAGLVLGKIMCYLSGRRINPLIGASGISAFPMSARVVQRVGNEEDFSNFLLMHAMGSNTAGQIASVMAGGLVLALLRG